MTLLHPLSRWGCGRPPGISGQPWGSTGDTGVSKTGSPALAGAGEPSEEGRGRVCPGHQRIAAQGMDE